MTDLPHRKPINEVDPNRFTGKSFTRRKTFLNSVDDYVAIVDGLNPSPTGCNGEEETLEKAQEAFEVCFWQWQVWALNQPGKATWYGAE